MKLGRNLARTFLDYYKLTGYISAKPSSSVLPKPGTMRLAGGDRRERSDRETYSSTNNERSAAELINRIHSNDGPQFANRCETKLYRRFKPPYSWCCLCCIDISVPCLIGLAEEDVRACVGVIGCGCNRFSLFYCLWCLWTRLLVGEKTNRFCFVFQLENVFETKY